MKIRTFMNYEENRSPRLVLDSRSATIPDQAMSIREIYDRFASGLPVSGARVPQYYGDEIVPDIGREPIARVEAELRVKEELHAIQQRVEEEAKQRKEAKKNIPNAPGGAGGSAPASETPGNPNGDVGGGSRPTANAAGTTSQLPDREGAAK